MTEKKEEKPKNTARNHPAENAGWGGGGCATRAPASEGGRYKGRDGDSKLSLANAQFGEDEGVVEGDFFEVVVAAAGAAVACAHVGSEQ